ncbi:MAG: glucose-6-phosphate dehydrogenase assembly protein OpcA [Acidobacteriota bacterium]
MNDQQVDPATIERQLAELWRATKEEGQTADNALVKAALWNVVAHTWSSEQHAHATETLSRASASVPQRTIVVEARPDGAHGISSWISTNCHILGGQRQVCSEEVSIRASGDRVEHVPPLVSALLLPDMPVAVWWLGDLPRDHHRYAEILLEPADRLIFDSAQFVDRDDLEFVSRIAEETTTAPADLNWARIEEWRGATAVLFDPEPMRARMHTIQRVDVTSGGDSSFSARSEALLYAAWITAQTGRDIPFTFSREGRDPGILGVELHFDDGSCAELRGDRDRRVVISNIDGSEAALDCVTRSLNRKPEDLIVRLLQRPEADRVYLKTLRIARRIAE